MTAPDFGPLPDLGLPIWPDNPIWEAILGRIAARATRWKTDVNEVLPDPEDLDEVCIAGSFSVCGMESKRRFLLRPACIDTPLGKETPSTLARDYLTIVYKRSPRASHEQIEFLKKTLAPMPHYTRPQIFKSGYYVDIKATYWSILKIIGWDIDYWPGRWLTRGRYPEFFPWPDSRNARNCLVSTGIGGTMRLYVPGRGYVIQKTRNYLANVQLYYLICDILNAIAAEVVAAGAIYVSTDGYICPSYESMARTIEIIAAWGLTATIKGEGAGVVYGVGSYKAGAHESRKALRGQGPATIIAKINHAEWLRVRFADFANERTRFDNGH